MSVTDSYTQSQTRLQNSVTELNVATAHWRRNAANAHRYLAATGTLIGHWLVHGATALHHNLAMHATFPQLLHQLRIKETRPSGKGKWVQVWDTREQALGLFPPSSSPYNAFNLSDALVTSVQDLWLRTGIVELVEHTNKQLKVKPFRREPP